MAHTSSSGSSLEAERLRYSQDLAEYTMRQFSKAQVTLDKMEYAESKIPATVAERVARILRQKSPQSEHNAQEVAA